MTKIIKKAFSVFLSVLLLVTAVPMNVFAMSAECTCGNTYDDNGFCLNVECNSYQPAVETTDKYDINDDSVFDIVYEISNAGQLYWFAEQVNSGNYTINGILQNDIVVNTGDLKNYDGESANDWRVWTPIGKSEYDGIFDGGYYNISGLYFNDITQSNVGLFATVEGVVRNINIVNSYFCAKDYVGGICGVLEATMEEDNSIIEYCSNDATIIAKNGYVGGICGVSGHKIFGCSNTGLVTTQLNISEYVGGVVGLTDYVGSVANCYNMGDVVGAYYVGGIAGGNKPNDVIDCSNSGDITGYFSYVGGICGANAGKTINCFNAGYILCGEYCAGGICGYVSKEIIQCYNLGAVDCYVSFAGGICGKTDAAITSCYNIGEITGMHDAGCYSVGAICGDGVSELITNCYYLSGCAVDGANIAQNGLGASELGTFAEDGIGTISKTTEKFENGEVCYLLDGDKAGTEDYVWGQYIEYEKYPSIGGTPVFYKESENKYFNIDYSDFAIVHQPTTEEPYVELYDDFRAQYQWYKVEKDLIDITTENADKVVRFDFESSYNDDIGWKAIMDDELGLHYFSFFTVELEAGETVVVELSDDTANCVGLFNFDTCEDMYELVTTGETTYSLTVETAGAYTLYVTNASNTVTAKAYIGEINYNIVEGATSSYAPTEEGLYVCEITYFDAMDGITEMSDEVEIPHKHNYDTVITDPTCTEQGYTTYTCKCGDSYVDDYVDATGHNYVDNICTGCGDIILNGWICEDGKWAYYVDNEKLTNKWIKDSVDWCYIGADGYCVTNTWQADSKGWCYIGADCRMVRSQWLNDNDTWYFIDAKGYMVSNKWMKDSKDWVYLGSNGAMLTNDWAKDSQGWCYVGADGYWVKNQWIEDNGKWYYIDANGYMVTGTKKINGKTYKFASNGVWIG